MTGANFYFLVGFLTIGMIFLAVGLTRESMQEVQAYLMPVAMVIAVEILGIRSLAFATGLYISVATTAAMFAGGLVRWAVEASMKERQEGDSEASPGAPGEPPEGLRRVPILDGPIVGRSPDRLSSDQRDGPAPPARSSTSGRARASSNRSR